MYYTEKQMTYLSFLHTFFSGKEARKKELKKNKKQRQMVRAAVLKMKDPNQIMDELQKIDEMGMYHKKIEIMTEINKISEV